MVAPPGAGRWWGAEEGAAPGGAAPGWAVPGGAAAAVGGAYYANAHGTYWYRPRVPSGERAAESEAGCRHNEGQHHPSVGH